MVSQQFSPAVHAGEERYSQPTAAPVEFYSIEPVEPEAASLNELVIENDWLRAGDVVYVTQTRRHVLTDADLNAAARAVIGGEA